MFWVARIHLLILALVESVVRFGKPLIGGTISQQQIVSASMFLPRSLQEARYSVAFYLGLEWRQPGRVWRSTDQERGQCTASMPDSSSMGTCYHENWRNLQDIRPISGEHLKRWATMFRFSCRKSHQLIRSEQFWVVSRKGVSPDFELFIHNQRHLTIQRKEMFQGECKRTKMVLFTHSWFARRSVDISREVCLGIVASFVTLTKK